MSKNKEKKSKKDNRGRPVKHGAYSINLKDKILLKHPRVKQYLRETREDLIRDVAGTEEDLSAQQRLLIDRIISKLAILRVIELWIEKDGIWRRDKLLGKPSVLELEPALGMNYLAFSNSIDRALKLLGIEKKADDMKVAYLEDL